MQSGEMLHLAAKMVACDDRRQASEKIWGAAAHRLKEIAAEREWPYDGHIDGIAIARHIAKHADDRQIAILFGYAAATHQNFYEDRMSVVELEERLVDIRALLELLDEAHRTLPMDLPMPDDRHYRRRHG